MLDVLSYTMSNTWPSMGRSEENFRSKSRQTAGKCCFQISFGEKMISIEMYFTILKNRTYKRYQM